jgi:hypothetical protein
VATFGEDGVLTVGFVVGPDIFGEGACGVDWGGGDDAVCVKEWMSGLRTTVSLPLTREGLWIRWQS